MIVRRLVSVAADGDDVLHIFQNERALQLDRIHLILRDRLGNAISHPVGKRRVWIGGRNLVSLQSLSVFAKEKMVGQQIMAKFEISGVPFANFSI